MYSPSHNRVTIDGNIGSGKTTQLELLRAKGYSVVTEPIKEWPLELFYSDRSRWGLLLQLSILGTFNAYKQGEIYERSPYSSHAVFWKMLVDEGTVKSHEDYLCTNMYSLYGWKPDVHIYIRTDPEKCYERISSRKQTGDSCITLEYLTKVHAYHENITSDNTHIIDGDQDAGTIHEQILSVIKKWGVQRHV
jgi:deoxyadenosine/deoxycytidine kinase